MNYLVTKSGQIFRSKNNLQTAEDLNNCKKLEVLINGEWLQNYSNIYIAKDSIELNFTTYETVAIEESQTINFSSLGKPKFGKDYTERMQNWNDNKSNPDEIFLFGLNKHLNVYLDGSSGIGKCKDEEHFAHYRDWYNSVKGANPDYINAKANKPWLLFRAKKTQNI